MNYRLSTGEEKYPESNLLGFLPRPYFALLSSVEGFAGGSRVGQNVKSNFPHSQSLIKTPSKIQLEALN